MRSIKLPRVVEIDSTWWEDCQNHHLKGYYVEIGGIYDYFLQCPTVTYTLDCITTTLSGNCKK